MELVKKHIHMNRRRNSVMTQITLDDDFNVPDSMDDVEQMILDSGEIQIETVKNLGGRVTVGGKLNFRILYRRPDGQRRQGAQLLQDIVEVHGPDGHLRRKQSAFSQDLLARGLKPRRHIHLDPASKAVAQGYHPSAGASEDAVTPRRPPDALAGEQRMEQIKQAPHSFPLRMSCDFFCQSICKASSLSCLVLSISNATACVDYRIEYASSFFANKKKTEASV